MPIGDFHHYGVIVNETPFELLPTHEVVDITPIAPETNVVPPCGGLKTETSTVPACVMSLAVMAATNCRLLTKVVTREEPFQTTTESRRKSLPLTVSKNWLLPEVALLGESEVTDGAGGHVPQDKAATSMIAITDVRANLGALAIGLHLRQTG
jgi:hypothetical protein